MEKDEEKQEEGAALCEPEEPTMTQAEYTETMETHQMMVQTKSAILTGLSDALKSVRESKAPLAQVKNSLQEEINKSNKAINTVSEEVTLLKQKLRYHNLRQINDNIERLEYQLRNNNYKPREEQKILDEISMLQRSVRTLREYEAKQTENRKYRAERGRLIEERNAIFTKIRELYREEDGIKKEIAASRDEISVNKKALDQLRQLRPKLEAAWAQQQRNAQAARLKRFEEKRQLRQNQIREKQEERRKLWEEYEASREPYEEEKNLCRVLISYLQSTVGATLTPSTTPFHHLSNSTLSSTSTTPSITPSSSTLTTPSTSIATTPSSHTTHTIPSSIPVEPQASTSTCLSPARVPPNATDMSPPESSGLFYTKPKADEDGFMRVNKRGKAKARREQRLASRVKELPHTPDVLAKFTKLAVQPPRNTDEVPSTILSLQDSLQRFYTLSVSEAACEKSVEVKQHKDTSEERKNRNTQKSATRPKSLAVKESLGRASSSNDGGISANYPSGFPLSPIAVTSVDTHLKKTPSCPLPTTSWASDTTIDPTPIDKDVKSNLVFMASLPMVNGLVNPGNSATTTKTNPSVHDIKPEINKVCTEILSPGTSDSFFSVPMSYASNLTEPNNNINHNTSSNINNNTGFSYAAITAKVLTNSVEILD